MAIDLYLQLPLDRTAIAETCRWVKSLFPGGGPSWGWMRKVLPGARIELQGRVTDDPKDSGFGTIHFQLEPERRRGAHKREATLSFQVEKAHLDYITLTYKHGNRELYL